MNLCERGNKNRKSLTSNREKLEGALTLNGDSKDASQSLPVSFLQSFPRLDEGARILMYF